MILSTLDGVLYAKVGLDGKRNENDEVLLQLPFQSLYDLGLAYCTICHGKENLTSHWCPWCMLSHASLQGIGHQLGELWDLGK
jgi:hypothetical protein